MNNRVIMSILVLIIVGGGAYFFVKGKDKGSVVSAANTITVNSCTNITPTKLTVTEGTEIAFANKDKVPHTIQISQNTPLVIAAGKNSNLTAKFSSGTGIYYYLCDGNNSAGAVETTAASSSGTGSAGSTSFKDFYNGLSASVQACVKGKWGEARVQQFLIGSADSPTQQETDQLSACASASTGGNSTP